MSQPYRIIDLPLRSPPLDGTELIEVSVGSGGGSFRMPLASASSGTAYYVSPTGNDSNGGTTPSDPLQTIAKVNSLSLVAGDAVLFQGGQSFSGAIVCPSSGAPSNPITFGSYGGGRATISSGTSNGFTSSNQAGIIVRDLIFTGSASSNQGILFQNTLASNVHLQNIQIINVNVSSYGGNGISINGNNGTAGYDDVLIQACNVTSCTSVVTAGARTVTAGIYIASTTGYGQAGSGNSSPSHTNVTVEDCVVTNCPGVTGSTSSTGSGIVLSQVLQGLVFNCEVSGNGGSSNSTSGPVGIFSFDSTRVTFSNCRAYNQSTALNDGEGFDLDGGCYDCEINSCFASGNRGAGFLLFSYNDGTVTGCNNNRIINCVSDSDGVIGNIPAFIAGASASAALTSIKIANCGGYTSSSNGALNFTGANASAITGEVINCRFSVSSGSIIVGSIPSGVTLGGVVQFANKQGPIFLSSSGDDIVNLNNTAAGGKSYSWGSTATGSAFGGGNCFIYDITDNLALFVFLSSTQQFCFSTGETIAFTSDVFGLLPDTGISRLSAGTLTFGNGTHADTTGALRGAFYVATTVSGSGQGFFSQVSTDTNARALLALDVSNNPYVGFGPGNSTTDIFVNRQSAGNLGVGTSATNTSATIIASAFETSTALVAVAGGAATPTLATNSTGGTGQPTTAGQNSWVKMKDSTGATIWVPVWK